MNRVSRQGCLIATPFRAGQFSELSDEIRGHPNKERLEKQFQPFVLDAGMFCITSQLES